MPHATLTVPTVLKAGAPEGSILCGTGHHNCGLRLKVLQGQEPRHAGPIRGRFVILDVGQNRHSDSLTALLGRPTDALEVLARIRRGYPGCVSVVNTNLLAVEEG
jgi:hypothetical protein